jgi:antirestriction protein ArdC
VDVYQEVTDRMIAQLEQGRVPWVKPWRTDVGMPRSIDGRPYRGINVFLLGTAPYADPRWGTFNAIKRHGGKVRKGERATWVVLWKPYEKTDKDTGEKSRGLMLRYFNVFNVEQTEGLDLEPVSELPELVEDDITSTVDMVLSNWDGGPDLAYGGGQAYYLPSTDHVQIPPRESFTSSQAFASTVFHELTHSTGHKDRLNRPEVVELTGFGAEPYSREELVAEMGAAMVAASVGIEPEWEQSAAYLASWLRRLRDDKRLVVTAAARAQKAADMILNRDAPRADMVEAVDREMVTA